MAASTPPNLHAVIGELSAQHREDLGIDAPNEPLGARHIEAAKARLIPADEIKEPRECRPGQTLGANPRVHEAEVVMSGDSVSVATGHLCASTDLLRQ